MTTNSNDNLAARTGGVPPEFDGELDDSIEEVQGFVKKNKRKCQAAEIRIDDNLYSGLVCI